MGILDAPTLPTPIASLVETDGHSYVEGQSVKPNRWATKLARQLGAREINRGLTGTSVANHANGWARTLQRVTNVGNKANRVVGPPYDLPRSEVVAIFYGINDIALRDVSAGANGAQAQALRHAFRTIISRYRAGSIREETDSTVVFSANWAANTSTNPARNSGTGYKYTSTNGTTATITLPSDFPAGATVAIGLTAEQSAGATWTFTKNGAAAGSIAATNPSASLGHLGFVHRITGCQPGDVIVGTTSAIVTETIFDYWQVEAGTATASLWNPPLILVFKQPHPVDYSAYGVSFANDATVDILNQVIDQACADFDASVVAVDLSAYNALRWFFSTADNLHPSDAGHSAIAAKAAQVIRQNASRLPGYFAQVNPPAGRNGQLGVMFPTMRGWYQGNQTLVALQAYAARGTVETVTPVGFATIVVTTAAGSNDGVEVAIYKWDGGNLARVYTTGVVTGYLNSTGVKKIPMGANAILQPGQDYYVVVQCPAIGTTAAQIMRAEFTSQLALQRYGTAYPYIEGGSVATTSPLPDPLPAITGLNPPVVDLVEV